MSQEGFEHFNHQVAGHERLTAHDGMVIKPCGARELLFYQTAQSDYPDFLDFIPQCYGTLRATTAEDLQTLTGPDLDRILVDVDSEENVCLENVLNGFTQPCIMDLKLGSLLYHADASPEKKERMRQQSEKTTSSALGIRICGMELYDPTTCRSIRFDKRFGKALTAETMADGFQRYFYPGLGPDDGLGEYRARAGTPGPALGERYRAYVLECFIDTLREIRQALVDLPQLSLISSSLLFVYEGEPEAAKATWKALIAQDRGESSEEEMPKMCDLRLIDFAQSDWTQQRKEQDQDLIKGIDNTLAFLSSLPKKKKI